MRVQDLGAVGALEHMSVFVTLQHRFQYHGVSSDLVLQHLTLLTTFRSALIASISALLDACVLLLMTFNGCSSCSSPFSC